MAATFHHDFQSSQPDPPYYHPLSILHHPCFQLSLAESNKIYQPKPLVPALGPLPCSLASLIFQKMLPYCSQYGTNQTPIGVTYIIRLPEVLL
jgi:hypothetical protein